MKLRPRQWERERKREREERDKLMAIKARQNSKAMNIVIEEQN